MEKQTKPEPLGAPMAKMILVVAIIVSLGAVAGMAGYLTLNNTGIGTKNGNIPGDKVMLQKTPKSNQFFYNGNLFIRADLAAAATIPIGEEKQIKNFLAWDNSKEGVIYTAKEENQKLYDIWEKKELSDIGSDKEAIKAIKDSVKAYFSKAEEVEEEQALYFGCKMKVYSKGDYAYTIIGSTIETIFAGIIYCPDDIASLSLEEFTSKLSEARISKGEESFATVFTEKVFHRKLQEDKLKSEEYIFKYGNYFIDVYYLEQGVYMKDLIFDNFYPIVEELVWRLGKGRTFSPSWEYPAGGKVILADFDSDGRENEMVIASSNKIYAFNSQKNLVWIYDNIEGNIYNVFAGIDLNSDGFSNEIILQTQNRIYAIDKTGELLWSYPVANFLGSFLIIPIDLDADGFADDIAFNYWKSVYVLDSNGKLKWEFSGNNKNIGAILAVDLDKDGQMNNLIIGQNGSQAEGLRPTIYAFDADGTVIWEYELPQDYIFTIIKSDLNCDGNKDEIIVGGNAGAFALNSSGELLWQKQRLGWNITSINLDKDDCKDELIVGEAGKNYALDSDGNLLWESPTNSNLIFNDVTPIDLDYDGYSNEMIVSADKIHALNSKGEEIWTFDQAKNAAYSLAVDLDGDGFKDESIIFGDRVYLLDSTGNLINTFGKAELAIADMDLEGISNNIILSFPDNTYIYNFTTNWQTYKNEKFGYEVKYPKDWYIYDDDPSKVYLQKGKEEEIGFETQPFGPHSLAIQITVRENSLNLPLKEWAVKDLKESYGHGIVVKSEEEITIGSVTGIKVVPECEDLNCEYPAAYISKDSKVFKFDEQINGESEVFNQMLSTFKFIK